MTEDNTNQNTTHDQNRLTEDELIDLLQRTFEHMSQNEDLPATLPTPGMLISGLDCIVWYIQRYPNAPQYVPFRLLETLFYENASFCGELLDAANYDMPTAQFARFAVDSGLCESITGMDALVKAFPHFPIGE